MKYCNDPPSTFIPHALLHRIHWSGMRRYLLSILDIHDQQSRLREIDSVAQIMLDTADIQCYKNGRYNNTHRLNILILLPSCSSSLSCHK